VALLRKDRLTRPEGIPKNAPGQLGVLGVLGEATTTGARITVGAGAAENELTPGEESTGGELGVQLRFSTLRGPEWCLPVPVIARRAGIAGAASKKTQV